MVLDELEVGVLARAILVGAGVEALELVAGVLLARAAAERA